MADLVEPSLNVDIFSQLIPVSLGNRFLEI